MVTDKKIKVMIADDHTLLREGLLKILNLEPDIDVVGEAADGAQAVELAKTVEVDVILMDINMPVVNGITATKRIKAIKPNVGVIALTIHNQEDYLFELIRCGISGYVLKDVKPDELVNTVRGVAIGQSYIPPTLTAKVFAELNRLTVQNDQPHRHYRLTDREAEVLKEVAKGSSNKAIAQNLFISEKTVKNHLTNIFQKIGVNDRTQAALFAVKHNIVNI